MTTKNLDTLTIAQLVALYNEHADKPVKKFRSKKDAIRRVKAVLPAKKQKRSGAKSSSRKRKTDSNGVGHVRPMSFAADAEQKSVREGTKRATVLQLLSRKNGATIGEVMEATGWDRKTAFDGIKLLHTAVGYGLVAGEDGRIKATTK